MRTLSTSCPPRRWFRPLRLERLESRIVPSFVASLSFDAGTYPWSVAVGEFNGDGLADLAVVGNESGTVSVLLGSGDGTFQAARHFNAGSRPNSVAVGEFNGDSRADLAVANEFGGTVSVLLGNGDGSFQDARNFVSGSRPYSVAVGDVNGDGRLDLAVGNSGNYPQFQNVSVLLGNGDGSFQAARQFSTEGNPRSVAVGEFNGDGRLDLAVTNAGGITVSVLLGIGDGSFQAPRIFAAGYGPQSVAVGEFNGDGFADLAVASLLDYGAVSVLLGNGNGTFQPARHFASGRYASSVAVGEFNGDGAPDLAVTNSEPNTVSVLLGHGDGTFQLPRAFAAGDRPDFVAIGEFNGDGLADLTTANRYGNNVSVLLGHGDGAFLTARSFAAGRSPAFVAVAELNGDGVRDLVVANSGSLGTVSVLLGNSDSTFQAPRTFAVGRYPRSVAVGEFSGDDVPDLVVANAGTSPYYGDESLSVLLGNGDGTFQAARTFAAGRSPKSVVAGDVNGDGLFDFVVAGFYCPVHPPLGCVDETVRVFLSNGDGTFQAARHFAAGRRPNSVAVGDVNSDGYLDLAVANADYQISSVSVLLGRGDGSFQAARTFAVGDRPESVAVGEFNGDGLPDLATPTGVLLGNGDGTFRPAQGFAAGRWPRFVAVGEFNGDDLLDLAVASIYSGVRVLLGRGDGTFRMTHASYVAGRFPSALAVEDFNGDGWPDLVVTNSGSDDVSILLNDGIWPNRPVVHFYVYPASGQVTAGTPFDVYVLALNALYGLVPDYAGAIGVFITDPLGTPPFVYQFRPGDQGIAAFPRGLTLRTPGQQLVYVYDTATFQVYGSAVFDVVAAAPGRVGGDEGVRPALDLFAGTALDRQAEAPVRPPNAAIVLRPEEPRRAAAPAPVAPPVPALTRAEVLPPLLDRLFAGLFDRGLWNPLGEVPLVAGV